MMLNPPAGAITPDEGTAIKAVGTPLLAAYAIAFAVKCSGPAIIKMAEHNILASRDGYFIVYCSFCINCVIDRHTQKVLPFTRL